MTRVGNTTNIAIVLILIASTPTALPISEDSNCRARLPPHTCRYRRVSWHGRETHYPSWQKLGSPSPPNVASSMQGGHQMVPRRCPDQNVALDRKGPSRNKCFK